MRLTVAKLGPVEWAFIFAILVLIVIEPIAFQAGVGPYVAVIGIGYLMALAAAYLLYRYEKSQASSTLAVANILRGTEIFKDLTNADIDALASISQQKRVAAGELLGKAEEIGAYLYVVVDGTAELSAHSAIGEITVRIAGPGESFPLASLIDSGSLITTATAMTDMELLAIPRVQLLVLWKENPEMGVRMLTAVAGGLAERYRSTLSHLTRTTANALRRADFWANV